MSIKETLISSMWKGSVLPARGAELADAHRRVVLGEAADAADRIAVTKLGFGEFLAGRSARHVARAIRRMADTEQPGKDTGDATQALAGEFTQAGPDLFSIVLAALSAGQGPVLPLPAHTARLLTARVTEAVTPLVRYRPVWDAALPPGGYVCNICGDPVESEPCPQHAPANAKTEAEAAPTDRRERYAAALRSHDPLSAVISVANDETDPVYTGAYATGREHAGANGWVLGSFEAVIATSDGSYGAAEEYRCRRCGAIGAQGTDAKSLLDLMAMAARHECLPRFEGGGAR